MAKEKTLWLTKIIEKFKHNPFKVICNPKGSGRNIYRRILAEPISSEELIELRFQDKSYSEPIIRQWVRAFKGNDYIKELPEKKKLPRRRKRVFVFIATNKFFFDWTKSKGLKLTENQKKFYDFFFSSSIVRNKLLENADLIKGLEEVIVAHCLVNNKVDLVKGFRQKIFPAKKDGGALQYMAYTIIMTGTNEFNAITYSEKIEKIDEAIKKLAKSNGEKPFDFFINWFSRFGFANEIELLDTGDLVKAGLLGKPIADALSFKLF
ncbi:hypothetical protein KKG83_06575 [Candidatus Micrarchaeota archaeon]|nr:hypothetical protein [Candidatus Micrarchaeota archaeon]